MFISLVTIYSRSNSETDDYVLKFSILGVMKTLKALRGCEVPIKLVTNGVRF